MTDIASAAAHLLTELEAAGARVFDEHGQKIVHQVYANLPPAELDYGTTVTYLLQQIHGYHFSGITDKRGYFYYSPDGGKSVCPFAIARRPSDGELAMVVVSPRGPNAAAGILMLSNIVREIDSACAFYVKKPPPQLTEEIVQRCKRDVTPWNKDAPFEDDTYPNVLIDVQRLADQVSLSNIQGSGDYRKIKSKLRNIRNKLEAPLTGFAFENCIPKNWPEARIIIDKFFSEKDTRGHLSKPVDYYNIFDTNVAWRADSENVIRSFTCFQGQKVGLVAAERIGNSQNFGVYSTLTIQPTGEHFTFSELQMVMLFHEIARLGGKHADLGGAETEDLQRFHAKFLPKRARNTPRAEMQPVHSVPWLQL